MKGLTMRQEMPPNMMMAKDDGYEPYFVETPYYHITGSWEVKIKCDRCGREYPVRMYKREPHLCKLCKSEIKGSLKTAENNAKIQMQKYTDIDLKAFERFMKASDKIRKKIKNPKIEKAISIADKRYDKYDSIPEAIAAITLIYLGYQIIPQQPIGPYHVDFALPEQNVIIEIDGALYHRRPRPERDFRINYALGDKWEVVHVPAEEVQKNPLFLKKVVENAIERLK